MGHRSDLKWGDHAMKVLMSLVFYPRGGSAQVARYLSRALLKLGNDVHLVTGTLRDGDPQHDAEEFFKGIPLTLVDYSEAFRGFRAGEDPMSARFDVPFHPSYEDKPGVPDRVFFKVTADTYRVHVDSWTRAFREAGAEFEPDLLHLHHLTHAQAAASTVFPAVPKLTHLHGTEIKMLERLDELRTQGAETGEPGNIARQMLGEGVDLSDHFAAISPDIRERGRTRLGIQGRLITTIPNGVDTSLFQPSGWSVREKLDFLHRILVQEPQGWDESGTPGSIRYEPDVRERFVAPGGGIKPLAIFVGRFLDFKRVPALVEAASRVNALWGDERDPPYNLLIWGGMPGEWEGEHPHTVARSLDLPNVFFSGWLPHEVLSKGLDLADLLVAPSYNEPFGQVFIEAMAAGLPVIATRSGGPLDFVVDTGPEANGWFSEVDDVDSLADTLHRALLDEAERKRRGTNALELVRREYDWMGIAQRYVSVYDSMTNPNPNPGP